MRSCGISRFQRTNNMWESCETCYHMQRTELFPVCQLPPETSIGPAPSLYTCENHKVRRGIALFQTSKFEPKK